MRFPIAFAVPFAAALILSSTCALAEETPWKSLFNGKDLTGWEPVGGAATQWRVHDGVLSCAGKGEGGHAWLSTTERYKNFELELEFRLPRGATAGFFCVPLTKEIRRSMAWKSRCWTIRLPNMPRSSRSSTAAASMAWRRPSRARSKPAGEWQKYLILCDGQHVKVTLNGMVVVDANLADYQNDSTHPGAKRTEGYIGLQNHSTPIDYRNIRLRVLP